MEAAIKQKRVTIWKDFMVTRGLGLSSGSGLLWSSAQPNKIAVCYAA